MNGRSIWLQTIALAIALVGVLSACSRDTVPEAQGVVTSPPSSPGVADLQGLTAEQALAVANGWKATQPGVTSYVNAQEIVFEFAGGTTTALSLPDDQMVVAVAPYITKTHPCQVHYISGCQGEMVEVPFHVLGTTADGSVVVDQTISTMENGFFELWLDRDLEIELTVEGGGRRATQAHHHQIRQQHLHHHDAIALVIRPDTH